MNIINLTPHPCIVLAEDPNGNIEGAVDLKNRRFRRYRKIIEIPPSGIIARVIQKEERKEYIKVNEIKVPITKIYYYELENLPLPKEGIKYYVSYLTAQVAKLKGRSTKDLLINGEKVRNRNGKIIGIISFAVLD